ncbi:MAG: site-2 protease family protein [Acidobacteria bacterium]|nr:site-2 protease family protein [Acidobacteriota bacterium]NIM62890.1 site-2 protease family protein [Acidobacteriota bacterium]NIO58833.1 site-2 protease family protein [Acidobacteriota bacterium]NIQ29890.1 site-2 protease family protein [Acidobacteriota bacterium]NIQ84614.1 site-2 protease family protein [Acidobacteriota bacterium]
MRGSQVVLAVVTFVSMAYSGGMNWDVAPHLLDESARYGFLPSDLRDFLLRCRAGLPFAGWLFAILGAHEMGHYIACRRYRIMATWPYFLPLPVFAFGTIGAVIRIRAPIPDRRALFDVALAGPVAGFVVAMAARVAGVWTAETVPAGIEGGGALFVPPLAAGWIADFLRPGETLAINGTLAAAWGGFLITALNLFPAGQLDGGHIAYAVSRRTHRLFSRAAIVLAAGSVVYALSLWQPPMYLLWLGILLWMRDKHPPVWTESVPLGRARTWLAVAALLLFVACFTLLPVRLFD